MVKSYTCILEFKKRGGEANLAFPYNPFIKRENHPHGPTFKIMDIEREVLIGEEMWDKIGGKGTFDELLAILEEVKRDLRIQ
jgi:hypothetical protein